MTKQQNDAHVKENETEQELEVLRKQLVEKDEAYKRALADYINLQRRTRDDQERFVKLATATLLERILEPLDNLELTAQHMNDTTLNMVLKQLQQALESDGLMEINALGKPFDSTHMEAIEVVDGEKEKVVKVQRKGYMLNGMVLRPALVLVGNGKHKE